MLSIKKIALKSGTLARHFHFVLTKGIADSRECLESGLHSLVIWCSRVVGVDLPFKLAFAIVLGGLSQQFAKHLGEIALLCKP